MGRICDLQTHHVGSGLLLVVDKHGDLSFLESYSGYSGQNEYL